MIALFGTAPTTLAALENPELLPATSDAENAIRDTAFLLQKIQRRLKVEGDALKIARAAADKHHQTSRRVQVGDKIWLNYSDSERARYLRKHGHGRAWRHPFTVTAVKPHAVKLHVPTDGSVPEVLEWQSLRKCSFAAPFFHDPETPLPDVNEQGLPLMPEEPTSSVTENDTGLNADDDHDGREASEIEYDKDKEYEIERVVSAVKAGRGWTLQVKWAGYPGTTPEPLWKVLRDTNHPDILKDIERCKADYYLQHPGHDDLND